MIECLITNHLPNKSYNGNIINLELSSEQSSYIFEETKEISLTKKEVEFILLLIDKFKYTPEYEEIKLSLKEHLERYLEK